MKKDKLEFFNQNRDMTAETPTMDDVLQALHQKNEQVAVLAAALAEIQAKEKSSHHKDRVIKEVRYMLAFTGQGDVTVNSRRSEGCSHQHTANRRLAQHQGGIETTLQTRYGTNRNIQRNQQFEGELGE